MGNRLMYGNYVEGYDMIDKFGQPVKLDYFPTLLSEEISTVELSCDKITGSYTWQGNNFLTNGVGRVNFNGVFFPMRVGSILSVTFTLKPYQNTPQLTPTDKFDVTFTYQIDKPYNTVSDLASDTDFLNAVGTFSNIQPVSNACNVQTTFTDSFNCYVPNTLTYTPTSTTYTKYEIGIDAPNEPVLVSVSSGYLAFQFPIMRYVDNTSTPTSSSYMYYEIDGLGATYEDGGVSKSLHSNRGYEIGIVYMDEYNRSTTALVSQNNTVYVDCSKSTKENQIRVTIPVTQIAPAWAKRYKLVIKPDTQGYETIYSNIYYNDTSTKESWIFLEGENMRKVEVGDRYIVKADSDGPVYTCVYATVLDKVVKAAGALGAGSPAGVYMKMNPQGSFQQPFHQIHYISTILKMVRIILTTQRQLLILH
jgi:hypothetical protein